MRKLGMLLLTCVLLLSLTACNAIKIDKGDAVVVEVGGVSVTKTEAYDIYQAVMQETIGMYQQFGIPVDTSDPEFIMGTKNEALRTIGEQLALEKGLQALGVGLTEEDQKALDDLSKTQYDSTIDQVAAYNQMTRADAEKMAVEAGFTVNVIKFSLRGDEIRKRLIDHLSPGLSVTDDDILERYDALLAEQKEAYAADTSQYVTDSFSDSIIVSKPDGMRYVKNIVIALPDELMAQVQAKDSALYEATSHLYEIEMELNAGEMEDSRRTELETDRTAHQAEFDQLTLEVEALIKLGQDQVRAQGEEVLALCKAEGADFDAILAEHSADKPSGDVAVTGYPVGADVETYVPSFTEAAMALQAIGDVSELVESIYGFHILQYAGDVTPGVVPLEDVKARISDLLLNEKSMQALQEEIARITEETEITTYADRL